MGSKCPAAMAAFPANRKPNGVGAGTSNVSSWSRTARYVVARRGYWSTNGRSKANSLFAINTAPLSIKGTTKVGLRIERWKIGRTHHDRSPNPHPKPRQLGWWSTKSQEMNVGTDYRRKNCCPLHLSRKPPGRLPPVVGPRLAHPRRAPPRQRPDKERRRDIDAQAAFHDVSGDEVFYVFPCASIRYRSNRSVPAHLPKASDFSPVVRTDAVVCDNSVCATTLDEAFGSR